MICFHDGMGLFFREEMDPPGGTGKVFREEMSLPGGTGRKFPDGLNLPQGIGKVFPAEMNPPSGTRQFFPANLDLHDGSGKLFPADMDLHGGTGRKIPEKVCPALEPDGKTLKLGRFKLISLFCRMRPADIAPAWGFTVRFASGNSPKHLFSAPFHRIVPGALDSVFVKGK